MSRPGIESGVELMFRFCQIEPRPRKRRIAIFPCKCRIYYYLRRFLRSPVSHRFTAVSRTPGTWNSCIFNTLQSFYRPISQFLKKKQFTRVAIPQWQRFGSFAAGRIAYLQQCLILLHKSQGYSCRRWSVRDL